MFRKTRKTHPVELPQQDRYAKALQYILDLVDQEPGCGGKVAAFDFVIRVIGRTLQAETVTDFVCANKSDVPSGLQFWIPFVTAAAKEKRVDLSPYHVISRPWERGRLSSSIYSVFRWGFQQELGYYNGKLYRELGIVVVENGRHHLTVAQLMGSATADLEIVELTPFFDALTTDGSKWFYEDREFPVGDYRIALLYELARQRAKLSTQEIFPEPQRKPFLTTDGCDEFLSANVLQHLTDINSDRQYLQEENTILLNHIERLVKRLQSFGVTDDILIECPITDILPMKRNQN